MATCVLLSSRLLIDNRQKTRGGDRTIKIYAQIEKKPTELHWKAEKAARRQSIGFADIYSLGVRYLIAQYVDVDIANHIVTVHNDFLDRRKGGGKSADTSGVGSGSNSSKNAGG
jgi:hypothetical protein